MGQLNSDFNSLPEALERAESTDLSAVRPELIESARSFAGAARAKNTLEAYFTDFVIF